MAPPLRAADTHVVFGDRIPLLRVYAYYRIVLAVLLLGLFYGFNMLGAEYPMLFVLTLFFYIASASLTLFRVHVASFRVADGHIFLICCLDILCLGLIMHASGGVGSGLALLLVVPVSAASIMLSSQIPTLLAALATLAVLGSTLYNILPDYRQRIGDLLPAGLAGFLYFITSRLFAYLTNRVMQTAEHAETQTRRRLQTQRLNELIVQRMQTGIVILSPEGTIRLMNESASALLHYPVRAASEPTGAIPVINFPALQAGLQQWRRAPQARQKPVKLHENGPEGQLSFATLDKTPDSDVIVFIEDTRKMTQQAQQLKLASLGHLTASIAHEIRNPVGAISHAAQLLAESSEISVNDQRLTRIIIEHTKRVNEIVENVLQLSRRSKSAPTRIPLRDFLESFVRRYREAHPGDLAIAIDCPARPILLNIDTSQMEQVLGNLCDNGLRYSRQATGKATLQLRGETDPLLGTPYLDIIDDGSGIAPEHEASIFEPFFTTEVHGTGLGLYIARELCETNQAQLHYQRMADGKSCFRISFSHADKQSDVL